MEKNQIKITAIIGAQSISLNIIGTGNTRGINTYFHIKRGRKQESQKESEVVYLEINTDRKK